MEIEKKVDVHKFLSEHKMEGMNILQVIDRLIKMLIEKEEQNRRLRSAICRANDGYEFSRSIEELHSILYELEMEYMKIVGSGEE